MAINQAYLFLTFTVNSVIIGLIFDFFRILRKSFKTKNLIIYFEDILFWILSGISTILFMYYFSDGSIRLYMFLGLSLGFIIYMLLISNIIMKIFIPIISFFKTIVNYIIHIFVIPFNFTYKVIFKFINFLYTKIRIIMKKQPKKIKKNLNIQGILKKNGE